MIRQEWDSSFWKLEIGRAERLDDLEGGGGYDCAWMLVPATDLETIQYAEDEDARFMDFRVEYARDTNREVAIARPIIESDVEGLAKIARTAFRHLTRFYADARFDDRRCDDLYEGWFLENVADPMVDVLMVGDGSGPAGFVTIKLDDEEASIVLIAVAEHARRLGMGVNLTRAAVNHAHENGIPRISVVTQGCNIPSQRSFTAAGFSLVSTSVWLHKWYA